MSGKKILCRCEDVTVEEFRKAYRDGFTELESLKRFTGVATGFCQGKGCLCEAAMELAKLKGVEPGELPPTNIRPPAEPLTFGELASLEVTPLIRDLEDDRPGGRPAVTAAADPDPIGNGGGE